MQCNMCGAQLADDAKFCTQCGTVLSNAQQPYGQQAQNTQAYGQQFYQAQPVQMARMSKNEFYKHPANKKHHGNIMGCSIFLYICCGLTFLVNVVLSGNIFGIVDVLILLGLALGIQIGKSRVAAVVLCVYSVFNLIFMLIATGRPGGYLIVIAAVYAIIGTFQFSKAWAEYQRTGMI